MWLFKKTNDKQPRKVALINVKDYPKSEYSAYWEIRIKSLQNGKYEYAAAIFIYGSNDAERNVNGVANSKDDADTIAQKWVIKMMKLYKRG